jgi:hypothetical protein
MAYDQEVVGSNHGTVYWLDVITLKKIVNKGNQLSHTKKQKTNYYFSLIPIVSLWQKTFFGVASSGFE